jgi:hypothetical protein
MASVGRRFGVQPWSSSSTTHIVASSTPYWSGYVIDGRGALSTFLQVLDELGIQVYSQREAIDTEVPLGRAIDVDRKALVRDRVAGVSLTCVAKKYGLSRASVVRFVHKGKRCQGTASPLDTKVESQMYLALEEIELGFVVNLETLREVLNGLSVNGRRWWIASDPSDALESHTVTVGHGDRACVDRLNTLYFRVPVINEDWPMAGTNKLILLLDCSVISAEQAGLYIEDGRVLKDEIADLEAFFDPIQRALLVKLQSWIIPS